MIHIIIAKNILKPIFKLLNFLTPIGDLLARIWVAQIFFSSGLDKIHNWDSTLMLFQNVYSVPLLSPSIAAYMGTAAELTLPVLLVLGLGGRFFIFLFFIYNIMCVISFHFLWTPTGRPGLEDHISWGLLLLLLMLHGPGKISLDHWLKTKWGHHLK